jgi:hypothetical protein
MYKEYVTARVNTPIFNTTCADELLKLDKSFLIRSLEMIAYPGSLFEVQGSEGDFFHITTDEYPSKKKLFVHHLFVSKVVGEAKPRTRTIPSKEEIILRLETFPPSMYVWGGNFPEGIPELFPLLTLDRPLNAYTYSAFQFKGVDCSGLLYNVTDGALPRNTSELCHIGEKVPSLRPLDLVVWPGHVLIALPHNRLIECRIHDGIVISPQAERLAQLESHAPSFIRWY